MSQLGTVFSRKNPPCFTLDQTIPVLSGTGCGPAKLSSEAGDGCGRECRWQRSWQRGQWEGMETRKGGDGWAAASSMRKRQRQTSDDLAKFQALRAVRRRTEQKQAEEERRQELKTECGPGDTMEMCLGRCSGLPITEVNRGCDAQDETGLCLRTPGFRLCQAEGEIALPAADLTSGRHRVPRNAALRAAVGGDI